jgi:hypothetical protein
MEPEVAMSWVMVPVPEHLEGEIHALILRLGLSRQLPRWDAPLLDRHLASLADQPRRALRLVANGAVRERPLDEQALADALGVPLAEVVGLVCEANRVTVGASPGALVDVRTEVVDDNGRSAWRRVHHMQPHLAELLLARDGIVPSPDYGD